MRMHKLDVADFSEVQGGIIDNTMDCDNVLNMNS